MRPTTLRYRRIYTNRVAASTVRLLDAAILVANAVGYNGLLAEFRSVVDAVRCAIELQHGMIERNAGVPAD